MQGPQQPVPEKWALPFFSIWTGQALSLFGSAIVQFALVWWLTQETGSAVVLTTATLVGMVPLILLGPFAGALVDRWNRRLVMIFADSVIAIFTLVLIWSFAAGRVQVWHIYVIMAIRSMAGSFHFPAMASSTPLMVPDKHLTRVSGINMTLNGLINMIAPPAGALLIGVMSTVGVLMIDVATALMAVIPLLFFPIPQPECKEKVTQTSPINLLGDVGEAMSYLSRWPGLVTILGMAFFLNFLLTPTSSLAPLLITKYFGKGALEFGLFDSAWGLGVVAGGLLLGVWGGFKRKVITSMTGIIGIGLGVSIVAFAPSDGFWMALVGMVVVGITNPLANGPLMALLQTVVRADMQGRVMALMHSASTAMTPLGLLIAGPVTDAVGIRAWYWVAGIVTLLMGIAGLFIPAVMHVEDNHEILVPESEAAVPSTISQSQY